MSSYTEAMESMLERYRAAKTKAADIQQKLSAVTGTATAQRQTVKVTVNMHGEITALEFPTGAYKRMTPIELAEAITSTVASAKAKAVEAMREALEPETADRPNLMSLLQGELDVAASMPDEMPMPDAISEYLRNGGALPESWNR